MSRFILAIALTLGLAAPSMMIGCEETLEHEKEVEVKDDGTVKTEETKVTEGPGDTVTKTEEKTVDKPAETVD